MPDYQSVLDEIAELKTSAEEQTLNLRNRPSHHRDMVRRLEQLKSDVEQLKAASEACTREKQLLASKRDNAKRALDRIIEHLGRCFLDGDSGQALAEARIARAQLD
jgi:hypothetical protein